MMQTGEQAHINFSMSHAYLVSARHILISV
jgi:hypothetical protein